LAQSQAFSSGQLLQCGIWLGSAVLSGALLAGCVQSPSPASAAPVPATIPATARLAAEPPAAPREFRAAWVATVDNIDWPSKRGLDADTQRKEIEAILDRAAALKLNALVVQVRTTADALYESKLEPWSVYLTGEQGKSPGYDPLRLWVDGAHARGIELHAWFNPYRAMHSANKAPLAPTHISKTNPAIVKEYGGFLWLDPGEPAAEQLSFDVFMDVIDRYDIDGIHIDDYFYPYPVRANPKDETDKSERDFPDEPSWQQYLSKLSPGAKPLSRADWRRQNINHFVERIYKGKQQRKPWVKFGISPFGLGRKGHMPEGITGFDQYEKLYADAALWLHKGWCDYFTPQLYWPIAQKAQSFPVLVEYWASENTLKRHLWPGLYTTRVDQPGARQYTLDEVPNQIAITREKALPAGHVHFSFKTFLSNEALNAKLNETYADEALVPATPWLDRRLPPAPRVSLDAGVLMVGPAQGREPIRVYAIWTRMGPNAPWQFRVEPAEMSKLTLDAGVTDVVVTAVDRAGNESRRVRVSAK
jgi:uncharacterized lipoprotein YddW (UPF0748 family)